LVRDSAWPIVSGILVRVAFPTVTVGLLGRVQKLLVVETLVPLSVAVNTKLYIVFTVRPVESCVQVVWPLH